MRSTLALVALGLGLIGSALASAPRTLGVQARLVTPGGAAITDPTEVTLRLHDQSTGGLVITSETTIVIPDAAGVFTHTLGVTSPLDPGDFGQALWLGVTIDGEPEISPRTELAAVPFTMHALQADGYAFQNTITLDVSEGGGNLLKTTLAGIQDASFGNPYLILLGPGDWDVGEGLWMKEHVSIQGVAPDLVSLTSTGSSTSASSAAVHMANYSALANLRVSCSGVLDPPYCNGVAFDGVEASLRDVLVFASGATTSASAVTMVGGSGFPELRSVEAFAITTSGIASGLHVNGSAQAHVAESLFEAETSGSGTAHGARLEASASLVARNCEFVGESSSSGAATGLKFDTDSTLNVAIGSVYAGECTGSGACVGIEVNGGASLAVEGGLVKVDATGSGAATGVAVDGNGSKATLDGTRVDLSGTTTGLDSGLVATASGKVLVNAGLVRATEIGSGVGATAAAAGSLLDGDPSDATLLCRNSFDATFTPVSCGGDP